MIFVHCCYDPSFYYYESLSRISSIFPFKYLVSFSFLSSLLVVSSFHFLSSFSSSSSFVYFKKCKFLGFYFLKFIKNCSQYRIIWLAFLYFSDSLFSREWLRESLINAIIRFIIINDTMNCAHKWNANK